MSETNESEPNGPATDIALKPEPAEGVKVVPGNNTSSAPTQPFHTPASSGRQPYYPQQPTQHPTSQPASAQQLQEPYTQPKQQHQNQPQPLYQQQAQHQQYQQAAQHQQPQFQQHQNFTGPRPVLRRSDSRNTIQYRQPNPYPNQTPVQQNLARPPQVQPRPQSPATGGQYYGPRPVISQGPRYQAPGVQQGVRYGDTPPESPFRRAVNAVTEGQQRIQRPTQPGSRPPGIYPPKMLPTTTVAPPSTGLDQAKKPQVQDNQEFISSSDDTQNGSGHEINKTDQAKLIKSNMDLNQGDKQQKYEETRPSSALGLAHDPEKDIDTTEINGKDLHREEMPERPESRTGFLSRDHSSHSSMHKIDEDDDDAVITPSRAAHAIRSGKTTPSSNSMDNIPQKYSDFSDKHPKVESSEVKKSPSPINLDSPQRKTPIVSPVPGEPKKSPLTTRNSSDNLSFKSMDIESSKPVKEDLEYLSSSAKYSPEIKPVSVTTPTEKNSRTQSPGVEKSLASSAVETPRSFSPEKEKPKRVPSVKKLDITSPASASSNRGSPSPKEYKITRKISSPRSESKYLSGRRTPTSKLRKKEGDNDSGVDETTQGNDRSYNGEQSSPKKTPTKVSKLPSTKCKTPVKMLQSPKSPDPTSHSSANDKKKIPMNKVQVGASPSPNIKTIKSKVGSLENTSYKPGGGKVRLENKKIDFSKVQPRIAAKNDTYQPGGGDKKIQQQKLQWNAKSKVGSLENATYKPGGGDKKIESVKLDFKDKAKSKVGSKDNMKHLPGGGDVKSVEEELQEDIEKRKIEISAQSKVGSLDNMKHKPGGGDIKIFDDKDYLKQKASGDHSVLSGSQNSLRSQQSQPEPSEPVSDENLNQER